MEVRPLVMSLRNAWVSGEVNKIIVPKRFFFLRGEKIYRELINVQLYGPKLVLLDHKELCELVLMEIYTREIPNTSVTWGALQIPCCWARFRRRENKATPKGQRCKDCGDSY